MLIFLHRFTFSKTHSGKKLKPEKGNKKIPLACNDTKCRVKVVVCQGRYLGDKDISPFVTLYGVSLMLTIATFYL